MFGVVLDLLFFDDIMLRGIKVGGGATAVDNDLAGDGLLCFFDWTLSSIQYSFMAWGTKFNSQKI